MPRLLCSFLILALFAAISSSAQAGEVAAKDEPAVAYERDIRPILQANCFHCHGEEEKPKGGLDLRLKRLVVQGGNSGPAIISGNAEDSELIARVELGEMPPGEKKLTPAEIATLRKWIDLGAPTLGTEPEHLPPGVFPVTEAERQFWAFQPIAHPELPAVTQKDRVRNPVDLFIGAQLEEHKLTFNPDADRATLVRRVYFDLLGLPPTPQQVADFVADPREDAYEQLIDRLLDSPHYGERWGRHWLDVAGYADSDGYTPEDKVRPHAYHYRDYVIRSLNADKPWDQFIQEQLAGDEMVKPPYVNLSPENLELLTATGFLRNGPDGTASKGVDQKVARNQVVAETIKIVSTSLLGMTVGCAECHNHRYDPIPQADYYRMRAIFEPAYDWKNWRLPQARQVSLYTKEEREQAKKIEAEAKEVYDAYLKKLDAKVAEQFEVEIVKVPEDVREQVREAYKTTPAKQTPEQKKLLGKYPKVKVTRSSLYLYNRKAFNELKKEGDRAQEIRKTKPVEKYVAVLSEVPGKIPVTYLFNRGDPDQPKQALEPGGLSILDPVSPGSIPLDDATLPTTGRRLAYARHLTDGKHPLTARVLVNRFWLLHFNHGIVRSPGDFGTLGERPTHPQLLDWLATEFMSGGWKLKPLHRLLMTSTTYRQSSHRDPAKDAVDPDNHWFGRASIRRLEAETLRDAMLAVSGQLNLEMYGPPVPVMENEVGQFVLGIENLNGENRPDKIIPLKGEEFRRSLYVQARRSRPLGMLDAFDLPTMEPNCQLRTTSTVAPQSLMLMNNQSVIDYSRVFASRLQHDAGPDLREQVVLGWKLAFGQTPSEVQIAESLAFLGEQTNYFVRHAPASKEKPPAKPAKGKAAKTPANAELDPQTLALSTFCQTLISSNGFLYID